MKNLKPILIMTLVSAFAVLTVVNMSLAKPKVTAANTLDMLEIMTRAFDESEGGEGSSCSPNECTTPYEQWDNHVRLKGHEVREYIVEVEGGGRFKNGEQPAGLEITAHYEDCLVAFTWECGFSLFNHCCPTSQIHCQFGFNNCGGGEPS